MKKLCFNALYIIPSNINPRTSPKGKNRITPRGITEWHFLWLFSLKRSNFKRMKHLFFEDKSQMLTYIGPRRYYSAVHWTAGYLMAAFFSVRTNLSKEQCDSSEQKDYVSLRLTSVYHKIWWIASPIR